MTYRKWVKARSWREFHTDDMIAEHNALYDEWKASERRVMETLDENNSLDRELDEARKRIAELEAPSRVPFSDAQIERMERAFWKCYLTSGKSSTDAIRAALAAGGLDPCAVPQYCPEDVAFTSRVPALEAKIERQRKNLNQLYTANTALREGLDRYQIRLERAEQDSADKDKTLERISQWNARLNTRHAAARAALEGES